MFASSQKASLASIPTAATSPENTTSVSESENQFDGERQNPNSIVPENQFDTKAVGEEYFQHGTTSDLDFVSKFADLEEKKIEETDRKIEEVDANGVVGAKKIIADRQNYLAKKLEDMPLKDYDFDDEDAEMAEGADPFVADDNISADADTKEYLAGLTAEQQKLSEEAKIAAEEKQALQKAQNEEKQQKAKEQEAQKLTKAFNEAKEAVKTVPVAVDASEVTKCGTVHAHVDGVIVVHGDKDSRALDLGSVLCTAGGEVLGQICDVFGKVDEPHYLVFPSAVEQAQAEGRTSGEQINLIITEIKETYPIESDVFYVNDRVTFAVDEDGIAFPPQCDDLEEEFDVEGGDSDEDM